VNSEGKRSPALYKDQEHLTVLSRAHYVVPAWKNPNARDKVLVGTVVLAGIYETSSKISSLVKVKEPEVAISKGANHEWLELMHRDGSAPFLWHDKV
jgi:hypothetical protein